MRPNAPVEAVHIRRKGWKIRSLRRGIVAKVKDNTKKRMRKVIVKITRGGREGCMITQTARDRSVLYIMKLENDRVQRTNDLPARYTIKCIGYITITSTKCSSWDNR